MTRIDVDIVTSTNAKTVNFIYVLASAEMKNSKMHKNGQRTVLKNAFFPTRYDYFLGQTAVKYDKDK